MKSLAWKIIVLFSELLAATVSIGAEELPAPPESVIGYPSGPVMRNGSISFAMDRMTGNPAWALHWIRPKDLEFKGPRHDNFHADKRIPAEWRAASADYLHSGYDQGHLIPFADCGSTSDAYDSFSLSNMAPQDPDLNKHFWAVSIEENGVRRKVRDDNLTAVVITLPLYDRGGKHRTIGEHQLWVPDYFAKAVLFVRDGEPAFMLAWIVPNKPTPHDANEKNYRASVVEIQDRSGLNLFSALPEPLQTNLEANK